MIIGELRLNMRMEQLYLKAQKRWPGKRLNPCGPDWPSSIGDAMNGKILLYYNIGTNTYAEQED